MQTDVLPEVKSRPVYSNVDKNPRSEKHVFVCLGEMPSPMADVYAQCDDAQRLLISATDMAELDKTIASTATSLPLSTTVYIAGDEAFLWHVAERFMAQGMRQEQIEMFAPESNGRSVFCCHCYHITPEVTHNPSACGGCGRVLAITDHFSRKSASYLGYQVNAEVSTEIPQAEELR